MDRQNGGGVAPARQKATRNRATPPPDAPEAQARRGLSTLQARLLAGGLAVYALVLGVFIADQVFGWGLVRPSLDRALIARIGNFANPLPPVPEAELSALRDEAMRGLAHSPPPPVAGVLWMAHDAARGLLAGVPPEGEELDALLARAEAVRSTAPAEARPAAEYAARLAERLARLAHGIPQEDLRLLRRHAAENLEPVIARHEFAVPHLLRALRRGGPRQRAVAAYCLEQIAWRFFRQRPGHGADADAWEEWWRRQDGAIERLSR